MQLEQSNLYLQYNFKRSNSFKFLNLFLLNLFLVKNESIKFPLRLKIKVSRFICVQLAHVLFQTSRLISSITKILSLTHRKCQSKPNI